MLYPSIDSLLLKIDSKYSLVSVAANRARAMQEKKQTGLLDNFVSHKFVGKALEEIHAGKLTMKKQNKDEVYEDES